jgi:uncharacterized protein YjbI with pentapeptide repeats
MGSARHDGACGVFVAVVWASWFALAMEWLFAVTKPSFMDALSLVERLRIPLIAPLPAVGVALLLTAALRLVSLAWFVPAAILACAGLLLVDNFTSTLFRFGVASTKGGWEAAYVLLLLVLLIVIYRALRGTARNADDTAHRRAARVALGLLLVSCLGAAWRWAWAGPIDRGREVTASRRPNILILSTDGLDAARLSAYGYRRETTPFITTLMPRALVGENALPNGTITAASVISMLTGKLPIRTRVYATKDVLLGADAYQTLPAILRRTGYATIALVPRFVDPFAQNLRDAFDVANARKLRDAVILPALPDGIALALAPEVYFLQYVYDRLVARLAHATGVRHMADPLKEVTTPQEVSDQKRVRALLDFVAGSSRPVFGLVHLMGTHGPFAPRRRRFARDDKDVTGRYDDAVLDYDRHVARVVRSLARQGKLDETIVVLTSDHGSLRRAVRIPFVAVFPHGEHAGRIAENVQLLDLAPTLLDHLGVPVPSWMQGQSLLAPHPDRWRPILTVDVFRGASGGERMTMLMVSVCGRTWELNFFHDTLSARALEGHTAPCGAVGAPDESQARAILVERLRANGLEPGDVTANVRELDMVGANMAGAHLAGARLAGRFLNSANLSGANLAGADLVGASFADANLTDADLRGADLRNSRFAKANLTRARLTGVDLSEGRLPRIRAQEANLTHAVLRSAWLPNADLRGADLSDADLTGADLNNSVLAGTRLRGATLSRANLVKVDLTAADLEGADLRGANLTGANLTAAILTGADLTGAKLPAGR